MDFLGKIVDMMCGTVGPAAARAVPSHVRNQVLARVTDHNPFAVLPGNHDLIRAVRIAWVEAALEVLKAAAAKAASGADRRLPPAARQCFAPDRQRHS